MNGDTNARSGPSRNQRRRKNNRNNAQKNEGQNSEKTNDEGQKKQTDSKKQGQQFSGKKQEKEKRVKLVQDNVLKNLPVPGPLHLAALSKLLHNISTDYGMSKEDLRLRWQVFNGVKSLFEQEIKGCSLRLYGSSKSALGLKTSDVNICVHEENEEKIPRIFIAFLNVLKGCKQYCEVKEEFEMKLPVINFKDVRSGLTCTVTSGNSFALCINSLLKIYGELDSRVKPLCHCFRLWAKICEVDRQTTGTLPPYSFFLMVIHYLQQIESPVLPVLHEKFGDELKKYLEEEDYGLLALIRKGWKTGNKTSLGELWLGLLRFYSDYEKNEIYVVNIRQKRRLKRSEKSSWGKKKFAIEDPFSTKRNVARTVLKNNVYRYIIEHLRVALVYFSCHPNSSGTRLNENKGNDPDEHKGQKNVQESHVSKRENRPHSSTEEDVEVASSDSDEDEQGNEDDDEAGDEDGDEDGDRSETEDLIDGIFAIDSINDSVLSDNDGADTTATDQSVLEDSDCATSTTTIRSGLIIAHSILPGDSATSSEQLDVEWRNAEYRFDDSVLRKGDAPETKCTYCGEEGHIVENCTAEQVTRTTKPLPPMPDWFKDILSKVCYCCKDDFGMTNDEIRRRQFYLKTLETYIKDYLPDARLHLFGSSCNGFGFTGSDIDLCMTLDGKAKNDIDCIEHIKKLANVLRKYSQCTDIVAITGAKVPIVKFFLRHAKVEADISMYNEVALMNTKLLATYVHIDQRVQILGCTLKIFVKLCDIGDASKGSLSSYAYILMLLHYLQQRRPPVLPVLQELYDTPEQPQSVVEGHNCWFYDDLKNLGTKWKARNTESCGELWLGFLRYYTEEFDYRRNVVCVRYLKPLTKFEKLWNGRQICIEDPFVLTHNLGAALTLNMVRFIRSTFERARERFGTARPDIPANGQDRQRFFFDTYFLTNGLMPPTDRNCNVCGKIGHWAKECPYNKSRRKKGEQNKAEKGQQNKAEKDQQSKTDKCRQSKDEKIPPDKIPPEKIPPEKIPQNIGEQGKQNSVEKGSQNQDKNIPINWAARIQANSTEKAQERQQEEMTKSNLEEISKVVQNPVLADVVAVDSSKLGNAPNNQRPPPHVQAQQTVVPPPLLSQQGQFPQPHASIRPNYLPRTSKYQPLSPPISPGNQMYMMPPMQPPSPMSNPLAPRPLLGMFPRTPLAFQQHMNVTMRPFSPPHQHPSPIRTPISPLLRPHPTNPMAVNDQRMFSEIPPQMVTVPGSPPQPGDTHIAQLFGSPNNPFQFNFFPRDHIIFLNNSQQPLGSPPLLQQGPGSPFTRMPVVGSAILNRSPRVISCEELERGDGHVQLPQRDQPDGVPRTPTNEARSLRATEKVPNTDIPPSVLEGLRSLNIDEGHSSTQRADQTHTVPSAQQEACTGIVSDVKRTTKDITRNESQDFHPPPKIQNVAVAAMKNRNNGDAAANQGKAFVFEAEYTEGTTGKRSRNRKQKNKRKQGAGEGLKDDEIMTEKVKDFQQHPQQPPQRMRNDVEELSENPMQSTIDTHHSNRKQERNASAQQREREQTRQPKDHRKPRELKIQYKNQRQLAPAFGQQTHPNMQIHHQQQQQQERHQHQQEQQEKRQQLRQQQQQQQRKQQQQQQKQHQQQKQQGQPTKQQEVSVAHDRITSPKGKQQKQQSQKQQQQKQVKQQEVSVGHNHVNFPKGRQPQQQSDHSNQSPKGRQAVMTSHNERTPTADANDQLVVKVTGEQRVVIPNSPQKSPANNSNEKPRRRRPRRKRKVDNTKDCTE